MVINSQSQWQRALTTKTILPKISKCHVNCTEKGIFKQTQAQFTNAR